ncbi:MAG: haloacid dehalogenase type II [Chloroflexi bacterium]|nr:haloacid dehalogenase type II [Chloroflexota bacterium]
MPISGIKHLELRALVFDGFGTLFDLESATPAFEAVVPGRGREILYWWRERQLAYTRQCVLTRRYRNLWTLMEQALEDACRHFQVVMTPQVRQELCSQYLTLETFPEVRQILGFLRSRYQLILLSHGTQAMLDAVLEHNQLVPLLDAALSVDAVRAYKPDLQAYELITQKVDLPVHEFGYTGVNPMDIAGARAFGMKTIWLHPHAPENRLMGLIADVRIRNLQELVS